MMIPALTDTKPQHEFRCEPCDITRPITAYPSEVCARSACNADRCASLNHCQICKQRMAKVFDQSGSWGSRTWFEGGLNRQLLIDGKPQYVDSISDMRRKFKVMSQQNSDKRGYDIKYSTEWGDGE